MLAAVQETTPRFIATLDSRLPVEDSLVRIPLAITGKWVRGASEFAITVQDLEEIVRNFSERLNGEINVDYDHASEMPEVASGGPIPSAGRIVRLDPPEALIPGPSPKGKWKPGDAVGREERVNGARYILWGCYEPTERARALIRNREYRYISPAIDWTARNKRSGKPQGTTLTSVALTNRPFLEELPQIRLSDPAYQRVEEPGNEDSSFSPPAVSDQPRRHDRITAGGLMKEVNLSVADGKIKIAHEDLQGEYFADPKRLKKCLEELGLLSEMNIGPALEALAGRPGASAAECLAEISQRLRGRQEIPLAEATSMLSEAEAGGKSVSAAEVFRAQVERELEEAVKAGKLLPKQRDMWRRIALSDAPTFRKLMAEQKPQVALRPVGLSGTLPEAVQEHVRGLAEQRVRERNISFGQALSEIGREQPELLQEYRRAVSAAD